MENQTLDTERPLQKRGTLDGDERAYGDFATQESSVLTEDPASYFILSLVQVTGIQKISELKTYFENVPELEAIVDSVLHRMEEANIVEINGDSINVLMKFMDAGSDPNELKRFLPNLFRITANRVLKNEITNPKLRKKRKEIVRWFTLPEDSQIAEEARAIDLEYKAKMIALQERSLKTVKKGTGVRFVGIVDCVLEPEDFR